MTTCPLITGDPCLPLRRYLAPNCLALAHPFNPMAQRLAGYRSQSGRLQPAQPRVRLHAREAELCRRRRMGLGFLGRSGAPAFRRLSTTMSVDSEDALGPPSGRRAGETSSERPPTHAALVRVRETPERGGMGRAVLSGPHQRNSAPAHLLPPEPEMSALLPASHGSVPRQE